MNPLQKQLSWWLWLATLSFGVVAGWVVYEVRWFYPDLQRHFGPVGDPQVGRQIITRSREYLQNGLNILASEPLNNEQFDDAFFQFELAYSFLNVGLYRERYDCTETSLNQLDQLLNTLTNADATDLASVVRAVNPIVQCATSIEQHQWELRQTRALHMAERLDQSQRWFLTVTGVAYSMGVLFLVFYEYQRRRTNHSLKSQLSWMEKALEDALTGAQNRRAFDQDLQRHFERFQKGDPSFSLLMCDLDYFKAFNDHYGHTRGDEALQQVVETITQTLRPGDQVYRYGGEELAILLPNTRQLQARPIADRAIAAVRNLGISNPTSPQESLTISAGLATSAHTDTEGADVLNRADNLLYQVKARGKNDVIDESQSEERPDKSNPT
ncbi:GGDEF domain-containing protein [Saccharospirillum impatiens]|uniref:GGDEF domain-containing protein n=1 Tax=Saccharospirillum impatiens TaxID=169438 RepID=UPI0003FCA70E|nr:GGDEF domain-containing protein [Saccharospirillum impatiens]